MESKFLDEANLLFDFSSFTKVERFDDEKTNPSGLKSVDFVAENNDGVFFIEVKDYQNPNATAERKSIDYQTLVEAGINEASIYGLEMGGKIKDSLLRKFALGEKFVKPVTYLLLVNMDNLGGRERGRLKAKISGHIPKGLNGERFVSFTSIAFDLVDITQLKQYGITCTAMFS